MAHVSKEQLDEEIFVKIYNQFVHSVSSHSKQKQGVLSDLLTDTEKVMFAKRLAAIFMILEEASFYHIKETLHTSTSTTKRYYLNLERGEYTHIEKFFTSRKEKKDLWLTLEVLVRAGMPPMGRGRWQWLNDMNNKY